MTRKYLQLCRRHSEYESAMSDIEETMSILSRRSRSTTPTSLYRNWSHQNHAEKNVTSGGGADPAFYGSLDRRLKGIYFLIKNTLFENHSKCRKLIFEFWHFAPLFVLLKLTCLVTLFDRKLQVFKNSPKWTIFGIFN